MTGRHIALPARMLAAAMIKSKCNGFSASKLATAGGLLGPDLFELFESYKSRVALFTVVSFLRAVIRIKYCDTRRGCRRP